VHCKLLTPTLIACRLGLPWFLSTAVIHERYYEIASIIAPSYLHFPPFTPIYLHLPPFTSIYLHCRSYEIASVTRGVVLEAIVAIFGTLVGVIIMLWCNKWKFTSGIGAIMLVWYAAFVGYVIATKVS